ncbi:hypothetical protein [Undibacterium curvum]|uniref:hypothetical protein n=1 Tax=Undibacterium curvum TaxID=2762294 RepID=UPI003D0BFCD9
MSQDSEYLISLIHELLAIPNESGWLEFKHNNADPQEIHLQDESAPPKLRRYVPKWA